MSYQIPSEARIRQLKGLGTLDLYNFDCIKDAKLKHVVISMLFKGLIGHSGLFMRLNVYYGLTSSKKLMSSNLNDVGNDIIRSSDYWGEIRFDFPKHILVPTHTYSVEFELLGDYPFSEDNYLGLIIDWDSPLAKLYPERNLIRFSDFYDIA